MTDTKKFAIWATTYGYPLILKTLEDGQVAIDMDRVAAFHQFLQSSLEQAGNEAVPEILAEWEEEPEGKQEKVVHGIILGLCELGFLQNYPSLNHDECKVEMASILEKSIHREPDYLNIEAYKK